MKDKLYKHGKTSFQYVARRVFVVSLIVLVAALLVAIPVTVDILTKLH